ncbi:MULTISPECIES: beta-ketoacyl-[acyl-carrier-protein] synthase family protein [Streptomyces]|uniref:Acyl carrier protein n=2 Tax=Streptomyces rimosus subsp. rimosus TaxID=132474 RepID=L8ELC3_STRR1|nr:MULTISPECIES: putative acyl carrier protein [Streptomyces]MYT41223.1 acyl carrier protein [Streptomyces sp. SID5471]QGY66383.1 acyl carrier protein [Streptomyces rimosus R6-500]QST79480.1 acyl carrier protein [Streptomyces rimosus subsp. rimosus ATCC 10970]QTL90624.1 acyl carrier protein [Streptomyces rimosus subsp. rimosus]UNZ07755.1 3-oxoacyl-(acyl carrier protein) synthase III [Streptomyces rimosus subsp. rimosus]
MSTAAAHVNGLGAELGAIRRKVAELPEYAGGPPDAGTGFAEYREAEGGILDLFGPAMRGALDASGTDPATVDTVLLATESLPADGPDRTALAGLLSDLGLRRAYPVMLGLADCSTAIAAFDIAASLVRSGASGTVLVVSGDLVRTVLPGGRVVLGGTAVAGDGAAAAVVSGRRYGWEVLGGARGIAAEAATPGHRMSAQLAMYQGLFADLWEATGLTPRDLGPGAVLPSNLARDALRTFLGEAGIADSQVYLDNVPRIAHCLGSDPLINLADRTAGGGAPSPVVLLGTSAVHAAAVLLRPVEE